MLFADTVDQFIEAPSFEENIDGIVQQWWDAIIAILSKNNNNICVEMLWICIPILEAKEVITKNVIGTREAWKL